MFLPLRDAAYYLILPSQREFTMMLLLVDQGVSSLQTAENGITP
jgi:hypothetical protein